MTLLRKLLGISSLLILLFACQKELSLENGELVTGSQWSFKEGASTFKGLVDTAYITDVSGAQALSIEGATGDGQGSLVIQIFSTSALKPGVYKTPAAFLDYSVAGSSEYLNDITAIDKFTVTIVTLDSVSVSGTFSGEVLDKTNATKTITEGKFSARLKNTSTPPPPLLGICKISNIGYFDLTTGDGYASLTSTFDAQNQVTKVQLIDSSNGNLYADFNLTYATNRVNISSDQYFLLDGNGRISEYHGYIDADTSGLRCIAKYTYDGNGYMNKVTYAAETAPTFVLITGTFTWTGGNLTKSVVETAGATEKIEFNYTYDASKTVKGFLSFLPMNEVIYNQSAINYGKNSTNVPTKSTYAYTKAGVTTTETSDYTAYVLDANNYVKSFTITGNGSIYFPDTKYDLTYRCY